MRADQRRWLAERDKLVEAAALRRTYQTRIDALEVVSAKWRALRRDVSAEEARTSCLVPPEAPYDSVCSVEEFAPVADSTSLSYQLQAYKSGDLSTGAGVVVFAVTGKRLTPIAAAATDGAYYEAPKVLRSPAGPLLVVPGHLGSTDNFNIGTVYLYDGGRLGDLDTESWQRELNRRLPKGWGAWKGIYPQYATLTAETPLWKTGDGNCCPSAGRAFIRLGIDDRRFVIASLEIKKCKEVARADKPAPSSAADADARTDICGKAMTYQIDVTSLTQGPPASDPAARDTAEHRGPNLIHKGFAALCAKNILTATEVAKRINRVIISWAGGADNFTAYFPAKKGVCRHAGDGVGVAGLGGTERRRRARRHPVRL